MSRALLRRHRRSGLAAALVLAVFFSAGAEAAPAHSPAHPIALEIVQPGREGLELTARLSEDGSLVSRGISWSVRTITGEPVLESQTGSVDVSVPPGDYLVDIAYGAAKLSRQVSLPEATRLMASFVLDAGALRIETRTGDASLPPVRPRIRVFSLADETRGKLVATGTGTGETIALPAGRYRVESKPAPGNAASVTDVEVKAGHVSTIAIEVKAGLARLSFVGSPAAKVTWSVEDARGAPVARSAGLAANLMLLPGSYVAKAMVGQEQLTASFRIGAGETRDIMLGN